MLDDGAEVIATSLSLSEADIRLLIVGIEKCVDTIKQD